MKIENLAEDTSDFTGNIWKLQNNGKTVLIDAGTGDSWNKVRKLEKIDKLILTHSHYDHVDNLPKITDKYSPEVYAYNPENLPKKASKLDERDQISLAGLKFEVIHTPGHKDDSICLYSSEEKILFAGDLLFPEGSFGRTDLDEGNRDTLIESIEKIKELDVEKMFSGHDEATEEDVNTQIEKSLEEAKKRESKY